MIPRRAILPAILRIALSLYLFCQILAIIPIMALMWFSTALCLGCDEPLPQPWLLYVLLGYLFFSSLILFARLSFRAIFEKWRYFFLFLALANATICSIPVLRFHKACMFWQFWLLFGGPFLMNAFILGVVLSKRLHTYIFPPKA